MPRIGWRLTLEPCGDLVAWSLLRAEDHGAPVHAWSGLIEDAAPLRSLLGPGGEDGSPLLDPASEARLARALGHALLPPVLQAELLATRELPLLTVCTRGWLSRVPWEALAIGDSGARLVQTCVLLGGLPPGLVDENGDGSISVQNAARRGVDGNGTVPISVQTPASPGLWVVDPGPPDGPWPPLYPAGCPAAVAAMVTAGDQLLPDGLEFSSDDLARQLTNGCERFIYFGHIAAESDLPGGVGLVLSGPDGVDLLTAHRWLRSPERWPMPAPVALLGCGSDDSSLPEQTGLVTAALNAGAQIVTATRWPLANTAGAVRLLGAVSAALREPSVLHAVRRWQCAELENWRASGDPDSSPFYWASAVTYDRRLLAGEGGAP